MSQQTSLEKALQFVNLDQCMRGMTWYDPALTPDDLKQQIRIALWKASQKYDSTRGQFSHFCRKVAHFTLLDFRRKLQRYLDQPQDLNFDRVPDVIDFTGLLLDDLPEIAREVLNFIADGKTVDQIKTALHLNNYQFYRQVKIIKETIHIYYEGKSYND